MKDLKFLSESIALSASTSAASMVPSLNANQLLAFDGEQNRALLQYLQNSHSDGRMSGRRIAIVATDGVEEIELTTPYKKLKERGAQVDLVSTRRQGFPEFGIQMPPTRETHILTIRFMENAGWFPIDRFIDEVSCEEYDAVIVPGGAWNPDLLRGNQKVLEFIQQMEAAKKLVAAICHGPQVLISAEVVSGKKATIWWMSMIDLKNAGAEVIDQPVVVDERLITSRGPLDLPDFIEAIVDYFQAN